MARRALAAAESAAQVVAVRRVAAQQQAQVSAELAQQQVAARGRPVLAARQLAEPPQVEALLVQQAAV